jgi:hypothetical protein
MLDFGRTAAYNHQRLRNTAFNKTNKRISQELDGSSFPNAGFQAADLNRIGPAGSRGLARPRMRQTTLTTKETEWLRPLIVFFKANKTKGY